MAELHCIPVVYPSTMCDWQVLLYMGGFVLMKLPCNWYIYIYIYILFQGHGWAGFDNGTSGLEAHARPCGVSWRAGKCPKKRTTLSHWHSLGLQKSPAQGSTLQRTGPVLLGTEWHQRTINAFREAMFSTRGHQTFSVKGKRVDTLSSGSHRVSITPAHLCPYSMKVAINT